ncbi:MAG: phenol hydroxylase [Gammaproteobacteria bacterium]|nr:phenol hydroxylase [Gammaproteobacteria bacterium]
MSPESADRKPVFDASCHYVWVRARRPDGYVEFDFSIGDPGLAVELRLPAAAFETFCQERGARHLTAGENAAVQRERAKWQFGSPDR